MAVHPSVCPFGYLGIHHSVHQASRCLYRAQQIMVLLPQLMLWDTRGVVGLPTVLQQLHQSQVAFMGTLTSLWYRLSNDLPLSLACHICNLSERCQNQTRGWFYVKKWPVAESSGGSVAKKPHSDPRMESHQSSRESSVCGASAVVTDSKKKGSHGGWHS